MAALSAGPSILHKPGAIRISAAHQKRKDPAAKAGSQFGSGNVLLFRAVTSQVPSALKGLTSVFGMGTGGSLSLLSPEFCEGSVRWTARIILYLRTLKTAHVDFLILLSTSPGLSLYSSSFRSSPRPISIIKHKRYRSYTDDLSPDSLSGVLLAFAMGHLFLRWASRLDAFSVYPVRISLPCCAVGTTTVAPVMRPLRSSRTRSSSSHVSYAHDG